MSTERPFWPCPNHCERWCRFDIAVENGAIRAMTYHHPRCEHVDASLIDVWRVVVDGQTLILDDEEDAEMEAEMSAGAVVTKDRMHREIFEALPEFAGF